MKLLFTEIAEHCSSIVTLEQTVFEPVQNNQIKLSYLFFAMLKGLIMR